MAAPEDITMPKPDPDDLQSLRNIGPAMTQNLRKAGIKTASDLRELGQIRPISRCYAQGYRPISSCITFCIWHFKVALGTIAKGLKKSNCAQVLIRFAMTTTIQTAANLNAKWIFLACAQNKSRTVD
jgi:hypothetical protein